MPFTHRLRVRYHECDAQGHVFNANYFAYFDIAITELWREALGSYQAMIDGGTDIVVAEARARWRGSARFDELVDVRVEVAELGTTSMTTRFVVARGDEELVHGELRHVFVDAAAKTKAPIPDDIRAALEPFRTAAPA